jgi:hypothetical protein
MAELQVKGGELVLHLSLGEKAMGAHNDLRVPLDSVRRVVVVDDAHELADHGFKIGERLPGIVEVGTVLGGGKKIFAAVHHATPRGVRVILDGGSYNEWIVGCADPEATVAGLALPDRGD